MLNISRCGASSDPCETPRPPVTAAPLHALQWLCIPFAWNNKAVGKVSAEDMDWIGAVDGRWGYYIDYSLLLIFGGIPWQVSGGPQRRPRGRSAAEMRPRRVV